jgi:hypothetical protein
LTPQKTVFLTQVDGFKHKFLVQKAQKAYRISAILTLNPPWIPFRQGRRESVGKLLGGGGLEKG